MIKQTSLPPAPQALVDQTNIPLMENELYLVGLTVFAVAVMGAALKKK